jgi:hypothetical protein
MGWGRGRGGILGHRMKPRAELSGKNRENSENCKKENGFTEVCMVGRSTTAKFRGKTCLLYTPALFSFRHHTKQPEKGVFTKLLFTVLF